ncbi:Uncharacterised protein [Vibrio cholerae]|uniref:Uncharacterized protein n=1 Tax=Vibrio cholerae TaxID=666 RepID=A0A655WRU1_VIBCL|nr:Uncharacterised protein [Vibrio cholerae]
MRQDVSADLAKWLIRQKTPHFRPEMPSLHQALSQSKPSIDLYLQGRNRRTNQTTFVHRAP